MILVFFGMTASGKSTLAASCAARFHAPCHNTDRVRKELVGLAPNAKRPDGINSGIYTKELSAQTYAALLERAAAGLKAGATLVILDGSYSERNMRDQARELARELRCPIRFVYCWCSEAETLRRLALRAGDAEAVSDGRPLIYRHQQKTFAQPQSDEKDILSLNTESSQEELLARLQAEGSLRAPPAPG